MTSIEINLMNERAKMYDNIARLSFKDIEKYVDYICKIKNKKKDEKEDLRISITNKIKILEKFPESRKYVIHQYYFDMLQKIVEIYFAIKKNPKLTVKELAERRKNKEIESYERAMKKFMQTEGYKREKERIKRKDEEAKKKWEEDMKKGKVILY